MADNDGQVPQFSTAQYGSQPAGLACAGCRQPIAESYFQIKGSAVCANCTEKLKAKVPVVSHAAFVRAVLFGVGGALLGLVLYVAVALTTGLEIGIVSLAVGFIVGKSMHLGSHGVGGRRYQIAAVILTYFAVSMAAVPVAIYQRQHETGIQPGGSAVTSSSDTPSRPSSIGKAIAVLVPLGLASPFLALQDPVHGAIGLVILFVGLRFAWRFTADRYARIYGPYTVIGASRPAAGGT